MGGNGRCKFHGGYLGLINKTNRKAHLPQDEVLDQTQMARQRHGLYSAALGGLFRKARHQAIYNDPDTPKLDLTPEIRLWRTKIFTWQEMLSQGKTLFETDKGKFIDTEDLVYRGTLILNRLIEAQKKLHPEADATGELTVRLVMDEGTRAAVEELDMPDLEASHAEPIAPVAQDTEQDAPEPSLPNALAEYLDADD